MTESTVDMLGQTYTGGDHVVYATTCGHSPVLKLAMVEKVELVDELDYCDRPTGKKRRRVGVRELANGRGFGRSDTRGPDGTTYMVGDREIARMVPGMKPPRVTYPMPENIVKVTEPAK